MTTFRRVVLRLLAFLRFNRAEAELAREIDSHLRLLEDQFVAQGMSADDARFAARRAFGGVEQVKERQRDTRAFRWLDDSRIDFKLGARMLVKYPGLSIVGGLGLAVAIAVGLGFFAFFDAYMGSRLPVEESDRVVGLENLDLAVNNEEQQALHDFVEWRDEMQSVEDLAAFRSVSRNLIVPDGPTELVTLAEMTASGFRVTRIPPLLGRPLLDEDEEPGARGVLVIGFKVWQTRFASDRDVIGREVRLGNTVHTVVGVMPEGYAFPVNHSYWVPLRVHPLPAARRQGPEIFIFGRLARGATIETAQAELTTLGRRAASAFPDTHRQLEPHVMPYAHPVLDIQGITVWEVAVMQFFVSLLLVIVAVNVGILVYARTATRQGEIAVRTALGASRGRIVGQLFIEALVLASVAAAVGVVLARYGIAQGHAIMAMEGALPYWINYGFTSTALLYVAGLTVLAAILAGVIPALQATGRRVQSTLRQLGGGTGLQLGRTWTVLIVGQVAIAVAGLSMAAAYGMDTFRAASTRTTFDPEQILFARFAMDTEPPPGMDRATYQKQFTSQITTLRTELATRAESEPWVADVTFARAAPDTEASAAIEVEGLSTPRTGAPSVSVNHVALDFFEAFGVAHLAGRRFTSGGQIGNAVIVNRTFAQKVLGGGNALGRRIRYMPEKPGADPGPWFEIVGVVSDLQTNLINPELLKAMIVHPLSPTDPSGVGLIVRVRSGAAAEHIERLREMAASIEPTVRLNARPLADVYRQEQIAFRLVTFAVGLVIFSVLLLSAAGIYALMSFTVAQRRKEIGIRTALGADSNRLLWAIFSRSAAQLGVGVIVGVTAVFGLDWMNGGSLLGADGAVLVPVISVMMITAGLFAAIGPARRGLRVPPTQALRES
jgi:putative ABC transport system permease protein